VTVKTIIVLTNKRFLFQSSVELSIHQRIMNNKNDIMVSTKAKTVHQWCCR